MSWDSAGRYCVIRADGRWRRWIYQGWVEDPLPDGLVPYYDGVDHGFARSPEEAWAALYARRRL